MGKSVTLARAHKPEPGDELSFVRHLQTQLATDPPKEKRARTRARLMIATCVALERFGFHNMRVIDITEAAGLAEGSFYVYFKDKPDAAITVLSVFLEDFFRLRLSSPLRATETALESIQKANRRWLAICRANAGLMRGVLQIGDEHPAFAELIQRNSQTVVERIARGVIRRDPTRAPAEKTILLTAYLLSGMMDELVRKVAIYPDRELTRLANELGAGDEALADWASLMWLRSLYPNSELDRNAGCLLAKTELPLAP